MNWPSVTVLMPVRNEGPFIAQSLAAVLDQDYPADRLEVIVCDGLSSDQTREIVRRHQTDHPNLKLIDNPGKIAPKALNLGKMHASGQIIARVDGHCVIAPDYVSRCVEHLQSGAVDGVGGPIETIGQTPVAEVIAAAMSSRFGVGGSAFRVGDVGTTKVDTIAFPVYTREIIERIGPYDEQLVRNQDDEYNYRLRKAGGRLMLAANVRSKYYSRASFRRLAKQYFQYGYWKVRVLQKHPLQMRARQFAPPIFVATLVALLALAPFATWSRWLLAALLAAYAVVVVAGTLSMAGRKFGWRLLLVPVALITLHVAYGTGFLVGLVRFLPGWFDRIGQRSSQSTIQSTSIG